MYSQVGLNTASIAAWCPAFEVSLDSQNLFNYHLAEVKSIIKLVLHHMIFLVKKSMEQPYKGLKHKISIF